MIASIGAFSKIEPHSLFAATSTVLSDPISKVVYTIFLEMVMLTQYAIGLASIILRSWSYLPSALPKKSIKIPSWNIGNIGILEKCFSSIWNPFPKEMFQSIGVVEGLRVTHPISYHPANGLCLGMSLTFLVEYLSAKQTNSPITSLLMAAAHFRRGGLEESVKRQAIYDALMGKSGQVSKQEKKFFCQMLQGKKQLVGQCQKNELFASVEAFLSVKNRAESLRQFVFSDLESQKIEITPDVYALTLELDALWSQSQNGHQPLYDSLHQAVMKTIMDSVQLDLLSFRRIQGSTDYIQNQFMKLACGQYLIQFSRHTIVLVKISDREMALWDPGEGLAFLSANQQKNALSQLLGYYGQEGKVALKVIAVD